MPEEQCYLKSFHWKCSPPRSESLLAASTNPSQTPERNAYGRPSASTSLWALSNNDIISISIELLSTSHTRHTPPTPRESALIGDILCVRGKVRKHRVDRVVVLRIVSSAFNGMQSFSRREKAHIVAEDYTGLVMVSD